MNNNSLVGLSVDFKLYATIKMAVSSTLVNVTEDAELRLVTLLAEAAPANLLGSNFRESCSSSITGGDVSSLLQTVVKDTGAMSALVSLDRDEATAAVSILAALLQRSGGGQAQLATSLSDAVVNAKDDGDEGSTKRKIHLLSVLYNMRADPAEKCELLTKMLKLAGKHSAELLAPETTLGSLLADQGDDESLSLPSATSSVPSIVSLLDLWNISLPGRRGVYRCICSLLSPDDLRRQRFLLLLVQSYKDSSVDADGIQSAKEVAVGAIRDPVSLFVQQRDLLTLPAIQALAKEDGKLFGLLKVFQEGKIADYQDYIKQNGGDSLLASLGLSPTKSREMGVLVFFPRTTQKSDLN